MIVNSSASKVHPLKKILFEYVLSNGISATSVTETLLSKTSNLNSLASFKVNKYIIIENSNENIINILYCIVFKVLLAKVYASLNVPIIETIKNGVKNIKGKSPGLPLLIFEFPTNTGSVKKFIK